MSTSTFFNNNESVSEQGLLENLLIESVKIYGIDLMYVTRKLNNKDEIYNADDVSTFEHAYSIEMYIKDYQGFRGDGNFLSKFGVEIRDQITFVVAKRRFEDELTDKHPEIIRPREGDLIYYPLNRKLFEVKFVENKPIHYPLGTLPSYELICELYEYSGEKFSTGIVDIDSIQDRLSLDLMDYATRDANNNIIRDANGHIVTAGFDLEKIDPLANNEDFEAKKDGLIDFSETNPFSE